MVRRVEQRPVVAFALPLPPVPMPAFPAIEAKVEGSTTGSGWNGHWVSGRCESCRMLCRVALMTHDCCKALIAPRKYIDGICNNWYTWYMVILQPVIISIPGAWYYCCSTLCSMCVHIIS